MACGERGDVGGAKCAWKAVVAEPDSTADKGGVERAVGPIIGSLTRPHCGHAEDAVRGGVVHPKPRADIIKFLALALALALVARGAVVTNGKPRCALAYSLHTHSGEIATATRSQGSFGWWDVSMQ